MYGPSKLVLGCLHKIAVSNQQGTSLLLPYHKQNANVKLWKQVLLKQGRKRESQGLGTWPNKMPPKRKKKSIFAWKKNPCICRIMLAPAMVEKNKKQKKKQKNLNSGDRRVPGGSSLLPYANKFLPQRKESFQSLHPSCF